MTDKHKLLVIGSDSEVRRILQIRLTGHGYEVETSPDTENAVELIQQKLPDAVILDVDERENGYKVIYQISQKEMTSNIACILLHPHIKPDYMWEHEPYRIYDSITKPFGIEALRLCLELRLKMVEEHRKQN